MKKLFTLGILLVLGIATLGPSQGQAFNSATHIYIADRVFPFSFDKINLYYGSIAPDIALYVYQPNNWPHSFCETHYRFTKLPYTWWNLNQKAFAKGWQTHNEIWGADAYAHGTCENYESCVAFEDCVPDNCNKFCNYDEGYVPVLANKLAEYFPILQSPPGPELAHFVIEVAIDLLLARYHDPFLGLKLLWAANYHSEEDYKLMLETLTVDGGILGPAEEAFNTLVIEYAKALALPDPLRMVALGELGSKVADSYYVDIDPAEVRWMLRVAMYLCQNPNYKGDNYMGVIRSAIEGIRRNPDLIK